MKAGLSDITVLFRHADFMVINKPIGVHMHDRQNGIIGRLKEQFSSTRFYLVHRLDSGTSGCLLLALNKQAAALLGNLFANRQIHKHYLAILDKKPKKKQGSIVGDMINRRRGQFMLSHSKDNPAITQFTSSSLAPGLRIAIVRPVTGKTHQIRVAMKSLGSPIIGDDRYGGTRADRLYLHAWHLKFMYRDELVSCYAPPEEGELFLSDNMQHWLACSPDPETITWPKVK